MSHGHSRPKCLIISNTKLTSCCRPPPPPLPDTSSLGYLARHSPGESHASVCLAPPRRVAKSLQKVAQAASARLRLAVTDCFFFSAALLSKIAIKKKSVLFVVFFFFPAQACTRLLWSAHGKFFPLYLVLLLYCISIYHTSPLLPPLPSHPSALLFTPPLSSSPLSVCFV